MWWPLNAFLQKGDDCQMLNILGKITRYLFQAERFLFVLTFPFRFSCMQKIGPYIDYFDQNVFSVCLRNVFGCSNRGMMEFGDAISPCFLTLPAFPGRGLGSMHLDVCHLACMCGSLGRFWPQYQNPSRTPESLILKHKLDQFRINNVLYHIISKHIPQNSF